MTKGNNQRKKNVLDRPSTWIIVGFFLWIGFFLGAVMLHAMFK